MFYIPKNYVGKPADVKRQRIAKENGTIINEMSPAVSIKETSTGFRIRTYEGELNADRLVYALNAYSVRQPF